MKQFTYILTLLIFIFFTDCHKKSTINKLTDAEFMEFISNDDLRSSISRLDSLAKTDNYSNHKTGLLYYEKGRIYGQLDKDIEAVGSLKKALKLFEQENNKEYIAKTNMLLSDSNAFLSNNDIAAEQINVALKIFRELKDKKGEAKALNSLAHIEFQHSNFDKSIQYVKQAAVIQEEIKDTITLSASYNNIGYILEQTEDFETAKDYYQKAIQLNKEIKRLNSSPLRNLGYVHLMNNETEQCKLLYLKALEIERQTGNLSIQKDIFDVLLEVSIKNQSFKNSTLYIAKRDSLNQVITELENQEKIKLIENQYNLIAKETELKQEKKNNSKNKIIFVALICLLSFLGLFFIQRNRNAKLKLDREKLILEQKMLQTQMNPHFIFNALTAIQKTIFDNTPLISSAYLHRFAKLIRQNFEFTSKREISLEEDLDALRNYIETQQLRFDDRFDYEINISTEVDISLINISPMLLQPFVENAIEHGLKSIKHKGKLQINILKEDELYHFEIIDNGEGYNKDANLDDREHAIEIFIKRLRLRGLGEEQFFLIQPLNVDNGTKVTIKLYL